MDWKKQFKEPPRKYAVYPIIHSRVADAEKYVDMHVRQGFGGIVGNIDYTPTFPHDTAAWDNAINGLRTYIDHGLGTWIYDEKGYPSGTAGGAVLEEDPSYEALGVLCLKYWMQLSGPTDYRLDVPDGHLISVLLVPADGASEPVDVTATDNGRGTLRFTIPEGTYYIWMFVERRLYDSTHVVHSWSEPRRYVDLFNPDATRAFIRSSYEPYADRMGEEFGKNMKAFFTDEPSLIAWNIPEASYPLLPWGIGFAEGFKARYGYDIGLAMVAVCTGNGPQWIRRRCDYWEYVADTLANNFFKVINDWCVEHGTALSGHMLEEEYLSAHVFNYGSYYRSAKEMGYPGIDILRSSPQSLMDESKLPIGRLAASFADVYGKKESMTEASDLDERLAGTRIPIDWARASVNWHFAQGINNINSYYVTGHYTDEELQKWNQYTARLGVALREGERYSRAAILYPESAAWASFRPTEHARNSGQDAIMEQMNESFTSTSWALVKRQVDFDYIDENELKNATLNNGKLDVLNRRYECLVLPCAYVLQEACFEKIVAFCENGGTVIAVDRLPEFTRENGERAAEYMQLLALRAEGKLHFVTADNFAPIKDILPVTVRLTPYRHDPAFRTYGAMLEETPTEIVCKNIMSHIRINGDEMIVFLCNMGAGDFIGEATMPSCKELTKMIPDTGETEILTPQTTIPLHIPAFQGVFYVLKL